MKINILELSEGRWTSAGQTTSSRHLVIYCGGHPERGVGFILDECYVKVLKRYWVRQGHHDQTTGKTI